MNKISEPPNQRNQRNRNALRKALLLWQPFELELRAILAELRRNRKGGKR